MNNPVHSLVDMIQQRLSLSHSWTAVMLRLERVSPDSTQTPPVAANLAWVPARMSSARWLTSADATKQASQRRWFTLSATDSARRFSRIFVFSEPLKLLGSSGRNHHQRRDCRRAHARPRVRATLSESAGVCATLAGPASAERRRQQGALRWPY